MTELNNLLFPEEAIVAENEVCKLLMTVLFVCILLPIQRFGLDGSLLIMFVFCRNESTQWLLM